MGETAAEETEEEVAAVEVVAEVAEEEVAAGDKASFQKVKYNATCVPD